MFSKTSSFENLITENPILFNRAVLNSSFSICSYSE